MAPKLFPIRFIGSLASLVLKVSASFVLLPSIAQGLPMIPQIQVEAPARDLVHQATLYRDNQRKELKDDSAPWIAFGLLEGPNGACSAQMVGPKVVLTAAHCLTASDGSGIVKGSYVFKAFLRGGKFIASSKVKSAKVGTADHKDYGNDWAVLLLEKDLSSKVGYLGIGKMNREDLKALAAEDSVYFVAYMRDWKKGLYPTWQKNCRFTEHILGELIHDCSTTYRASGAALILRGDTEGAVGTRVIALNVGQYMTPDQKPEDLIPFDPLYGNIVVPSEKFYDTVMEWRKF